jgi:hypothetical protein
MLTQQFTNDSRTPGLAYGFDADLTLNSQRLLFKGGDIEPAFHSMLVLLPEQHVGLFVSYNGGIWSVRNTFLQAFLDHYYPVPKKPLPAPPAGFAERISRISGDYLSTRHSYTTSEKLATLFATVSVTDAGNGRLVIDQMTFAEVAPWVFHQVDGQQTVVFRSDPNGMLMFIGGAPTEAFIKVAWYDTPTFHLVLVVACVLLFLSALGLGLPGFIRRAMRRDASSKKSGRKADLEGAQAPPPDKRGKPPLSHWGPLPHLSSWLVGVLAGLNVLILLGSGLMASYQTDLQYGVPPLLTTLFALGLVSAFLTVGVVVFASLSWWGRFWSVGRRVHYTLVALAALAFAWELLYWNLLGFRA